MRSLRYLNSVLTVLAVLLTLQLFTAWTTSPAMISDAQAAGSGIPDAGAQRKQIVDELKLLNSKVNQLNTMFSSGAAKVTVIRTTDDDKKRGE
jgi:hypothetical protein